MRRTAPLRAGNRRRTDLETSLRTQANPVRDLFDATAHHYAIRFTCRGCRRVRIFPAAAVWWLFHRKGWTDWLRDVPKHFSCRVCERKVPVMDLVEEAPNDTSLPLPGETDWKRELRRRR